MVIYSQPWPLPLLQSLKHLPQRLGKQASSGSLKTASVWLKHEREVSRLRRPAETGQGKEPTQLPRDLEPGYLLSHLQIFFNFFFFFFLVKCWEP